MYRQISRSVWRAGARRGANRHTAGPPDMPPPLLAPPPDAGGIDSDDEWGCATHPAPQPHPRELNTRNCGPFLAVAPDKLSARYDGNGAHGNDVGAAQADVPVPDDVAVFYFELRVASAGARGCIGIGFTDRDFKTSRQPGCAPPRAATAARRASPAPTRAHLHSAARGPVAPLSRPCRRIMPHPRRGCRLAASACVPGPLRGE